MKAYLLHENDDWMPPFRAALGRAGVPFEEWFMDGGQFNLAGAPPEGVFFSRVSASAHTRGHAAGVEYARALLGWLGAHGRRVLNGRRALALEMSKARQLAALEQHGLRTPPTCVVSGGPGALIEAAETMPLPFVAKPNRGGKGLGVRRFDTRGAFADYARSEDFAAASPDGLTLLQPYIEAREPIITRCEFVGGRFLYAIRADTSEGFELCPAEACRVDAQDAAPLFVLREDVDARFIQQCERFTQAVGLDVAGLEFIEDAEGRAFVYDINATTNYNPDVERAAGVSGADAVAQLLARELDAARGRPAREPADQQTAALS